MSQVRAVIVEDEEPARQNLREYLADAPWVTVVGEAADGASALGLVDELEPDLAFVDVRLPEMSGLDVVRRLRHVPELVFTTAYDRYAIAAFELGAIDYLMKPFGRDRFATTLERVRTRLLGDARPDPQRARHALGPGPLDCVFARRGDRIVPIPTRTITRLAAQGDYVESHSVAGVYLLHVSLADLLARLPAGEFLQVHRSHVVRAAEIAFCRPHDDRRLEVVLRDGTVVVASRRASEELRRRTL